MKNGTIPRDVPTMRFCCISTMYLLMQHLEVAPPTEHIISLNSCQNDFLEAMTKQNRSNTYVFGIIKKLYKNATKWCIFHSNILKTVEIIYISNLEIILCTLTYSMCGQRSTMRSRVFMTNSTMLPVGKSTLKCSVVSQYGSDRCLFLSIWSIWIQNLSVKTTDK